jgi:glycogen operon protein
MALGGGAMEEWDDRGKQIEDDDFLLLFNADGGAMDFTIPAFGRSRRWVVLLDTNQPELEEGARTVAPAEFVTLEGRSMVVLCGSRKEEGR